SSASRESSVQNHCANARSRSSVAVLYGRAMSSPSRKRPTTARAAATACRMPLRCPGDGIVASNAAPPSPERRQIIGAAYCVLRGRLVEGRQADERDEHPEAEHPQRRSRPPTARPPDRPCERQAAPPEHEQRRQAQPDRQRPDRRERPEPAVPIGPPPPFDRQ